MHAEFRIWLCTQSYVLCTPTKCGAYIVHVVFSNVHVVFSFAM